MYEPGDRIEVKLPSGGWFPAVVLEYVSRVGSITLLCDSYFVEVDDFVWLVEPHLCRSPAPPEEG